jgi:hypothetical protein
VTYRVSKVALTVLALFAMAGAALVTPSPVGAVLGPDLAASGTVTVSSFYNNDPTYGPAKANDGNDYSDWASAGCSPSGQPWVRVTWSSSQTISTVRYLGRESDSFGQVVRITTSSGLDQIYNVGQDIRGPNFFMWSFVTQSATWVQITSESGCYLNGGARTVEVRHDPIYDAGGGGGGGASPTPAPSAGGSTPSPAPTPPTAGQPPRVGAGGTELGGSTGSGSGGGGGVNDPQDTNGNGLPDEGPMKGKTIYGKTWSSFDKDSDLSTDGGCAPSGPLSGDIGKPLMCLLGIDQCTVPEVWIDVPGWLSYVWCELRNLPRHLLNGLLTLGNVVIDLALPAPSWGDDLATQLGNGVSVGNPLGPSLSTGGASGDNRGPYSMGLTGSTSVDLMGKLEGFLAPLRFMFGAMVYGWGGMFAWGIIRKRVFRQEDDLSGVVGGDEE